MRGVPSNSPGFHSLLLSYATILLIGDVAWHWRHGMYHDYIGCYEGRKCNIYKVKAELLEQTHITSLCCRRLVIRFFYEQKYYRLTVSANLLIVTNKFRLYHDLLLFYPSINPHRFDLTWDLLYSNISNMFLDRYCFDSRYTFQLYWLAWLGIVLVRSFSEFDVFSLYPDWYKLPWLEC